MARRSYHVVQRGDTVAVGIGAGIRLRVNELSAQAAVEQLATTGRLTLPNTVDLRDVLDADQRERGHR
jgi:hypothetical protein